MSESTTMQTPARIHDFAWGMARTATLVTALDLDLFTAIARGSSTFDALQTETGASKRGLLALLTALEASDLLDRSDDTYTLPPDVAQFLVAGSQDYLGDMRHIHRQLNFNIWPQLTDAVKEGTPRTEIFAQSADDVWSKITPYMDALASGSGRWIASAAKDLVPEKPRVFDAGCGYGGCGRALIEQWGGSVRGIDRESSVAFAREFADTAGIADRAEYQAGDLFDEDWDGPYDVVLLSNVLHGYPPEQARDLLARSVAALNDDNSVLVLNEIVPDDTETDPVGAFFSLQMLMTSEGYAHDLATYAAWLNEVGYTVRRQLRSPTGPGTLIVAAKGDQT